MDDIKLHTEEEFGVVDRIIATKNDQHLTVTQIARTCKVSTRMVSRYLASENYPTVDFIIRFTTNYLHSDYQYLFTGNHATKN